METAIPAALAAFLLVMPMAAAQDRAPSAPPPVGPPAAASRPYDAGETTATSAQPVETLADDDLRREPPETAEGLRTEPGMGNESYNVDPEVGTPIKPAPYPYQTGPHADPGPRTLLPGHEPEPQVDRLMRR